MKKNELKKYKALLEAKERALSQELLDREGIEVEIRPDPVDTAQHTQERDLLVRNLDRQSLQLRDVRSALARIADGSYGVCLECEREISPKRLDAVPWTPLCVACQQRADAREPEETEQVPDRFEPAA